MEDEMSREEVINSCREMIEKYGDFEIEKKYAKKFLKIVSELIMLAANGDREAKELWKEIKRKGSLWTMQQKFRVETEERRN